MSMELGSDEDARGNIGTALKKKHCSSFIRNVPVYMLEAVGEMVRGKVKRKGGKGERGRMVLMLHMPYLLRLKKCYI